MCALKSMKCNVSRITHSIQYQGSQIPYNTKHSSSYIPYNIIQNTNSKGLSWVTSSSLTFHLRPLITFMFTTKQWKKHSIQASHYIQASHLGFTKYIGPSSVNWLCRRDLHYGSFGASPQYYRLSHLVLFIYVFTVYSSLSRVFHATCYICVTCLDDLARET